MLFVEEVDKSPISRQLSQFSVVAEQSFEMSGELIGRGLHLLDCEYGGVVQSLDGNQEDEDAYRIFEIELLKERFGSWTFLSNDHLKRVGYRSEVLDDLLSRTCISRDHLEDLSRSEKEDACIDAEPWAWRYRRDVLERWRSMAHRELVTKEKRREFEQLGLVLPAHLTKAKKRIENFMGQQLEASGYKKSCKKYDKFGMVYTNADRIRHGIALEFALDVDATPIMELPITVNLRLLPVVDQSGLEPFLIRCIQRGNFFKLVEPLVPNFGVYRVAWDFEQLEVMLYAYRKFFDVCIPCIEKVCERIE